MTNTETAAPATIVVLVLAALGRVIHAAEIVATAPGAAITVLDRATGRTYSIGYDAADDDDFLRFGWWTTDTLADGRTGSPTRRGNDVETAATDLAQAVRIR